MVASVKGTPNAAAGTTVTIPTHAVGDLIAIFAYRDGTSVGPSKPAAGGTVPTWIDINTPTVADTNSSYTVYAVATATNHTSGTWAQTTGMVAVVVQGQKTSTPIGGKAESGSTASNSSVAPAITLSVADGSSLILEFYGHKTVTAWSAAPAGYTRQASAATEVCCNTKDVTTTDGSIAQPCTTSSNVGYRGSAVEILAAPALNTGAFFAMF